MTRIGRYLGVVITGVLFFMLAGSACASTCSYVLEQSQCPKELAASACSQYAEALEQKYYYSSCVKAQKKVITILQDYEKAHNVTLNSNCRFMAKGMMNTCLKGDPGKF